MNSISSLTKIAVQATQSANQSGSEASHNFASGRWQHVAETADQAKDYHTGMIARQNSWAHNDLAQLARGKAQKNWAEGTQPRDDRGRFASK